MDIGKNKKKRRGKTREAKKKSQRPKGGVNKRIENGGVYIPRQSETQYRKKKGGGKKGREGEKVRP